MPWAYFADAMAGMALAVGEEAARTIDTIGVRLAVDVGGASGSQVHAPMAFNPELHGVVFDTPAIGPDAKAEITRLGPEGRLTAVAADLFDSVPEGDLHLPRYVLHDWDDEACVRILRNRRKALRRVTPQRVRPGVRTGPRRDSTRHPLTLVR